MGVMHFIWLGEKPLPEDSRERIRDWKTKNPSSKLWLWVDKSTLPAEFERFYAAELPSSEDFKLMDIHSLSAEISTIPHGEQTDLRHLFELALYESNRLTPNYGAASDILRYLILFLMDYRAEHWHAYFDHDVPAGPESIESFLSAIHTQTLFFPLNHQARECSANDALICTQAHHPILHTVLDVIFSNYVHRDSLYPQALPLVYENAYENSVSGKRQRDPAPTIFRTGPAALIVALRKLYRQGKLDGWDEANIMPGGEEYDDIQGFIPPTANAIPLSVCPVVEGANTWLPLMVKPVLNLEIALQRAEQDIRFEAQVLRLMRLDDQVKNIVDALQASIKSRGPSGVVITASGTGLDLSIDPSTAVTNVDDKSTYYGQPTELENRVAQELVHYLKTKNLDCARVAHCQFVSRYQVIRDYYTEQLPSLLDEHEEILLAAKQTVCTMISKDHPNELAWDESALQLIIDYWLARVIPSKRESYRQGFSKIKAKEMLNGLTTARRSPSDAAILLSPIIVNPSESSTATARAIAHDEEGEGGERDGRGSKGSCCIVM